ncbi:hypothetical protein B7P43_G08911 [Cryptotermes secundus]|uniref:Ionotropic glutamate receptor C-terminal domain-containing protein n=1 Tax=Cryptotermes secundus TaxID=105785 RepID=A0A2J7QTE1_9NEOP|nr:hypothetical protein B7P43_G08911 [Cryptotermes secundus]
MPLNDIYFGRWSFMSGLINVETSIYKRRGDLQGTVINAVTADDPPIVTLRNNQTEVMGFFGRVWQILEEKMNFRTNYTIATDLTKGKPPDKGDCSGMIGMLECGEVDVALGSFSTSSYPTGAVKFSMPLIYTTPRLWLVLLATILFISLYLATFYNIGRRVGNEEAGGPELYSFYDSILYIFGAFCQQETLVSFDIVNLFTNVPVDEALQVIRNKLHNDDTLVERSALKVEDIMELLERRVSGHDITPRSTSCRLIYITAYFTALVLLAAYSAALISSLTVYRNNLPFQDLEGILRDKTYKLGVMDKSEMYYTVSDPKDDSIFRELYLKLMTADEGNFPATTLGGLQRVCNIKYAFIAIPESVRPLLKNVNCSVVPLPYKTYPISLAMAFSSSSPYTDFWNYRLRMLRDGGVIHRLRVSNWPYLEQYETKSSIVGVDLRAVAPLLFLMVSSVVVSVVVLFMEKGNLILWRRRLRSRTRSERIASRQRSVLHGTTPSARPSSVYGKTGHIARILR